MKKVTHHIKSNATTYILVVASIIIGVLICFSFETIRYTKYIEPRTLEMDPRAVYSEIMENPGESIFLDVRSQGEYDNLHASSSVNLPIAHLYNDWRTLPRDGKKIYLICTSGRLAGVAYGYLQLHGFRNIVHVTGGIQNWVDEGLPTVFRPVFLNVKYPLDIPVKLNGATTP